MTIRLENVSFRYTQGIEGFFGQEQILQNISFRIDSGEFVGIVGPSGSGKTTLIQHFNGLLKPVSGRVLIDHKDITGQKKIPGNIRKKIGIVFQFPELQFFENTVYDEVSYGPRNLKIPGNEIEKRVREAFDLLELDFEDFRDRAPFHLSEGQKRRVAIASILVMKPEVLIFDEPTAGMDFRGVLRLKSFIRSLKNSGRTVILVSHDMAFIAETVDRILCLKNGQLIFDGTKIDFFSDVPILQKANLSEPEIVRLARALRQENIPVPFSITDLRGMKRFLEARLKSENSFKIR